MHAVIPPPSPSPPGSPVLDLFTKGLSASELWSLAWPALTGAALLAIGAVTAIRYVRQWLTSDWPTHWAHGVVGVLLMVASMPAFLAFGHRVESSAAARGVPVLTFVVAVAAQLGVFDEDGGRRRRRR